MGPLVTKRLVVSPGRSRDTEARKEALMPTFQPRKKKREREPYLACTCRGVLQPLLPLLRQYYDQAGVADHTQEILGP